MVIGNLAHLTERKAMLEKRVEQQRMDRELAQSIQMADHEGTTDDGSYVLKKVRDLLFLSLSPNLVMTMTLHRLMSSL